MPTSSWCFLGNANGPLYSRCHSCFRISYIVVVVVVLVVVVAVNGAANEKINESFEDIEYKIDGDY